MTAKDTGTAFPLDGRGEGATRIARAASKLHIGIGLSASHVITRSSPSARAYRTQSPRCWDDV